MAPDDNPLAGFCTSIEPENHTLHFMHAALHIGQRAKCRPAGIAGAIVANIVSAVKSQVEVVWLALFLRLFEPPVV